MVIDFETNGAVQALHRDAFPLSFLGAIQIERASHIVFDEQAQLWDIRLPDDSSGNDPWPFEELKGFKGYDIARMVEVKWLDEIRLHGLARGSDEARGRLLSIRKTLRA